VLHAPVWGYRYPRGVQRAPTPAVIDLIQHAHDLFRRRRRLHLSEQVIGELALLVQIQQHDFGLCVGMLWPEDGIQALQRCANDQTGIVRGVWQLADNALGKLGFLRIEHAGADRHANTFAQRALGTQLLTGARGNRWPPLRGSARRCNLRVRQAFPTAGSKSRLGSPLKDEILRQDQQLKPTRHSKLGVNS
jgi:hypothetical protein